MIGTRVGIYEIVEEIGKGGMATVYRAYQPNMERFVAVKIIHRSIATDPGGLERFNREARLVARLEHPYLLPVYDYDGKHDPPYIVMRYLESGTLRDILDRHGALPLPEVSHIMRQMSAALDYAHRQGVVHRDIKPSNIMVDAEGNGYITDFGIARMAEVGSSGLTQTGFAVGTPGYMSPEQGIGDPVDGRSDIYALGVMLFEMSTGQMPYNAETPMGIVLKHIQSPIPSAHEVNSALPMGLDAIIAKALAKKPADRYTTAAELADALTELIGTISMTRGAGVLRSAAQAALQDLQSERNQRKEEIDQTMREFESARRKIPQKPLEDTPTLTPTEQKVASRPKIDKTEVMPPSELGEDAQPIRRAPWIFGLIAIGVLGLVFGGVIFSGILTPPQATMTPTVSPTEPLIASAITETEPALTDEATSSPQVTVTRTDTPAEATAINATATDAPPTETETLAPSATPTVHETEAPRPTPATPIVRLQRDLQVRSGPGTNFEIINTVSADEVAELLRVSADGRWYEILLPDGSIGWIIRSDAFVTTSGNLAIVPTFLPPTATFTPTVTETPIPPTETATPEPTLTETPLPPTETATPEPTLTETPIPPTETATPEPITPTAVVPTATPIPVAQLPYIADFESAAIVDNWDFDRAVWQVISDGGQNILIGQAQLNQPLVIVGRDTPAWLAADEADLVINFRFNLDPSAAGLRLVYRYNEGVGYNALEMLPGLLLLRRNGTTVDLFNRDAERTLRTQNVPIQSGRWYNITLWAEGTRVFVYLDQQLVMQTEDLITPQLGAGQILLQTNSSYRPIRIDDLVIQRAEPASDHFQTGSLPPTWTTSNIQNTTIETENNNNQYVRMEGQVALTPTMRPLENFTFRCRMYNEQGGYQVFIRESDGGAMRFDLSAGNLVIDELDANDGVINSYRVPNFYARNVWENLTISFIGTRLAVYMNGGVEFEENLLSAPAAGTIRIATRRGDIHRVDDCLITETAGSSNVSALFALDVRQAVMARPFRLLASDLDDSFDDIFRTDDWWLGGQRAAGTFEEDPAAATNQRFLRMVYGDRPTWRLFRDVIGVEIFGAGTDTRTFRDSTDVLVTVQTRLPGSEAGTAWLGVRTTQTITGADLNGYFLELQRDASGQTTVSVRYQNAAVREILFEGPVEGLDLNAANWVTLEIVTLGNQIAFFVDDRFIVAEERAEKFDGTVALGVDPGTTADFDTLVIRDTSPHDQ